MKLKNINNYMINLQWSEEDQLFLVTIAEFSDRVIMPCTRGKTHAEAIHNAEEVIEMYLEAWQFDKLTNHNSSLQK
jgi:predicted RNase H-like HicB family nuclease